MVDTIAGDPEVLQADAETYYEKLLKKSLSTPDVFSIPGGGEVVGCCFLCCKLDTCRLVVDCAHDQLVGVNVCGWTADLLKLQILHYFK